MSVFGQLKVNQSTNRHPFLFHLPPPPNIPIPSRYRPTYLGRPSSPSSNSNLVVSPLLHLCWVHPPPPQSLPTYLTYLRSAGFLDAGTAVHQPHLVLLFFLLHSCPAAAIRTRRNKGNDRLDQNPPPPPDKSFPSAAPSFAFQACLPDGGGGVPISAVLTSSHPRPPELAGYRLLLLLLLLLLLILGVCAAKQSQTLSPHPSSSSSSPSSSSSLSSDHHLSSTDLVLFLRRLQPSQCLC